MMHQAFMKNPSLDSEYPLETLLVLAEDVLSEVKAPEECDPGFISSYCIYPRANALSYVELCPAKPFRLTRPCSMKGFYHVQTARLTSGNGDFESIGTHFAYGGQAYLSAAKMLPVDEENHISKSLSWIFHATSTFSF